MLNQKTSGYLLALSAVFLWSLNILIARQFATELTPIEFAFGRWLLALMILLPMGWNGLCQHKGYLIRHGFWLVCLAVSGVVLENTLIYLAAHTVGSTDLSLLNLLGPLFLTLLTAFFLKKRLSVRQIFGILITVCGVILIVTHGHLTDVEDFPVRIGDFWMILNSLCFAVYSLLQLRRPAFISQTTLLTATVLIGVLLLLPFFIIWEGHNIRHLTTTDYLIFIYLGLFNSVLAYLAWNSALARIGAIRTGVIFYLQPVFSISAGFFLLGTPVQAVQVIGGIFVLIGICLVNQNRATSKNKT